MASTIGLQMSNFWNALTGQSQETERTNATNKANVQSVESTNQANRDIAAETNQTNRDIAAENMKHQRDLFEYNKALQEEIFNREDTSHQRTAKDMINAGLNPLSMQGTNGAGEVIAQNPIHNEFQAQQSAPMQAAQYMKAQTMSSPLNAIIQTLSASSSIAGAIGNLSMLGVQRDKLQAESDRIRLENKVFAKRHGIYGDQVYNPHGWDENQAREFKHKVEAKKFDSDSNPERIATSILEALNGRYDKSIEEASDNVKEKVRESVPLIDEAIKTVENDSREKTIRERAAEKGYTYLKGQTTSTIFPHPYAKYNTYKIYDKKGKLIDQFDMDYQGNIINDKKTNSNPTNKSGKF